MNYLPGFGQHGVLGLAWCDPGLFFNMRYSHTFLLLGGIEKNAETSRRRGRYVPINSLRHAADQCQFPHRVILHSAQIMAAFTPKSRAEVQTLVHHDAVKSFPCSLLVRRSFPVTN